MTMLTVIGCDGGPLPAAASAAVAEATLLVGGARHLATVDSQAERVVLGSLTDALLRLSAHDGPAVVLASGDPGFFGIVRRLRRCGMVPAVIPAPSSVAWAYSRLGLPWDDALVVSAHGRPDGLRRAANACRAHPKVAVLTGPDTPPPALVKALRGWSRRIVVASRLGSPDERFTSPDGDWADPNVTLVFAEPDAAVGPARWVAGTDPGPPGWALPESRFARRGSMITRCEVRAMVLARLGPRLGDLIWDVGAGCGSVAVESARLGAAVVALDRDPESAELIRRNCETHGVNVLVRTGEAPPALAELPDPDGVFVGGGGVAVLRACIDRRPARLVASYAALERVGPACAALRAAGYATGGAQIQASRLAELPGGVHRLAGTNPVTVVWGEAP